MTTIRSTVLHRPRVRPPKGEGVTPQRRLRELDLLRFLSALLVLGYHYAGVTAGPWKQGARNLFPELGPVVRFGHLGVLLFFLISGFVILMSGWGRKVGDFAVSRLTRLFPAYWVSVLLAVALFYTTGTFFNNAQGTQGILTRTLPNLTMLEGGLNTDYVEGLYWTLWVEVQFYLLITLLIWRGVTYARTVGFMVIWLFVSVLAQETGVIAIQNLVRSGEAPYFIAGMAFYLIYRYRPNLVLWMIIGACWALSVFYKLRDVDPGDDWPGVYRHVVPAVITLFYVIMALVAMGYLRWLKWRFLTVLGALTYPLYLTHETVARPLVKYLYPRYSRYEVLAICIIVALATAYLIYRLIERPLAGQMSSRLKSALAEIRAGDRPPMTVPE